MNSGEILNKQTNSLLYSLMAFVLGLLSANNIFYVFVIGTTPILLITVYAILCLGFLFVSTPSTINTVFRGIPNILWTFMFCTLLSVVMVIIFNPSYLYQWLVGIIDLLLYTSIILLVIALKEYTSSIIKGIVIGIIINAVFVGFALILFKSGSIFTLHDVFPAWNMPIQTPYNSFRGWGLFLEPGHLMRYVAIMTLLVYFGLNKQEKTIKYIFVLSVAIIMTFTISSSIAIFVIGLISFLLLSGKTNKKLVINASILLVFAGIALILFSKISTLGAEILQYFMEGLFNFKATDSSSEIRKNGMKSALFVVKDYAFIGCGWNTFTKVFQDSGFYIGEVKGSYSELLTLVAELGIGAITYLIFLFSNVKYNIKKRDFYHIAIACSIMIYFALFSLTDYSLNGDCAVFIGLIIANRIQDKGTTMLK